MVIHEGWVAHRRNNFIWTREVLNDRLFLQIDRGEVSNLIYRFHLAAVKLVQQVTRSIESDSEMPASDLLNCSKILNAALNLHEETMRDFQHATGFNSDLIGHEFADSIGQATSGPLFERSIFWQGLLVFPQP